MSFPRRLPQLVFVSIGFLIGAVGVHWLQERQDQELLDKWQKQDTHPSEESKP